MCEKLVQPFPTVYMVQSRAMIISFHGEPFLQTYKKKKKSIDTDSVPTYYR